MSIRDYIGNVKIEKQQYIPGGEIALYRCSNMFGVTRVKDGKVDNVMLKGKVSAKREFVEMGGRL
jgi:hypothetical protein